MTKRPFQSVLFLVLPALLCTWLGLWHSLRFFENDEFVPNTSTMLSSRSLQRLDKESQREDSFAIDMSLALQETLCPTQSRFVDLQHQQPSVNSVRLWTNRLLYLSVYQHQHPPLMRITNNENQSPSNTTSSSSSCHCPSATKYLVFCYSKAGLGANFRLGAIPALIAGLVTDRVVVAVNGASSGPPFVREPWPLASCPSRDATCLFRPLSPCQFPVATAAKLLEDAYELKRSERRVLFRDGTLPVEHRNDTVLLLHLPYRPQRLPSNLPAVLYHKAHRVVESLKQGGAPHSIVDRALESISQNCGDNDSDNSIADNSSLFNYYGSGSPLFESLLIYALRPNEKAAKQLHNVQAAILSNDQKQHLLGLPIRASDKCGVESECLSFSQHLAALEELAAIQNNGIATTVLVTSESSHIHEELARYQHRRKESSSNRTFEFITNSHDIVQNTGYLLQVNNVPGYTADRATLSALSSLHHQLHTQLTLGNCCSNFHLLLKDLLKAGCGSVASGSFHCLQTHSNTTYRVCCAWDKSEFCQARRQQTSWQRRIQHQTGENQATISSKTF